MKAFFKKKKSNQMKIKMNKIFDNYMYYIYKYIDKKDF